MNNLRTAFTNEKLLQAAEILEDMAAAARETAESNGELSKKVREHNLKYLEYRRYLDKVVRVRDDGSGKVPEVPEKEKSEYLLEPFENAYCEIFCESPCNIDNLKLPADAKETYEFVKEQFLTERERRVVDGMFAGDGIAEIAHEFNVTRERIRQIYNKAIRKLRNPKCVMYLQNGLKEQSTKIEVPDTSTLYSRNTRGEFLSKLHMPVRAFLAVRNAGCVTIGDLDSYLSSFGDKAPERLGSENFGEIFACYVAYLNANGYTVRASMLKNSYSKFLPVGKPDNPATENKPRPVAEIREVLKNTSIDTLKFSVRCLNCLHRARCNTVADVEMLIMRPTEMQKVRNLGPTGCEDVVAAYARLMTELHFEEYANMVLNIRYAAESQKDIADTICESLKEKEYCVDSDTHRYVEEDMSKHYMRGGKWDADSIMDYIIRNDLRLLVQKVELELRRRGLSYSHKAISENFSEYYARGGRGNYEDIADYIERELAPENDGPISPEEDEGSFWYTDEDDEPYFSLEDESEI